MKEYLEKKKTFISIRGNLQQQKNGNGKYL
jgi:hypothetical protein